ncbi:MAG TPA: hypothetical protein VFF48_03560 [Brevundimonas sp.]|nr:hypothetical protein [Brevundimonas sp.]
MARKPATAAKAPTHKPPPARARLEWVVAGLGLAVTLTVLVMLALAALEPATSPVLSARAVSVTPVPAGFRVEAEVRNTGGRTAAAVEVEGVLTPPAGAPETATTSLDYLPRGGAETASLLFREDPHRGRLELTVRGWSEP